jgi:small subunit ribosomal protein S14
MAKLSSIENNNRRRKMAENKKATRDALRAIVKDKSVDFAERIAAVHKLSEMPRNSASIRVRNRCEVSGRPRGFYRKFKMSRIALRELGSQGLIPGLTKASW